MRRVVIQEAISLSLAVLIIACSAPNSTETSDRVVVRDSAGVKIVTYPAGPFIDTISPVPLLTIGEEGEPNYEFFRLANVVSLASGNVVVANGGTHELRFYDSQGRYLRTVGRRGGGPAEFGFLSSVSVHPGDTLVVYDPNRRRLVYFDSAGTLVRGESFARDLPAQPPQSTGPCLFPGLMGVMDGGVRVIRGWGCMLFEGGEGRRPTVQSVVLEAPERQDSVGVFTAAWVWERRPTADPRNSYSLIPFLGAMTRAVGQDHLYISEGSEFEIRIFDRHARLVGLLREDTIPPQVTESDREAYLAEQANAERPHPDDVPFPDRFASYFGLMISYEGDLWAQRYPRPADSLQHWVVFPSEGQEVRRLVMPDFVVRSVRDGLVYAYRSDTLGIQTVMVLDARQ